jgi:hypothetical protein
VNAVDYDAWYDAWYDTVRGRWIGGPKYPLPPPGLAINVDPFQ